MDPDDSALTSALRAVSAHYRRCAQQQALGALDEIHDKNNQKALVFIDFIDLMEISGHSCTCVPLCWLAALAERLSPQVAQEAAQLVAACLAVRPSKGETHEALRAVV